MYAQLLTFLAVILLFELYTPPAEGSGVGSGGVFIGTALTVALYYVVGRLAFALWERRVQPGSVERAIASLLHASLVQRLIIFAVGIYALILYLFQWKTVCLELLGQDVPRTILALAGILPFIVLLFAVWAAAYPARKVYLRPQSTFLHYLAGQAKLHLSILAPWVGIMVLMDIAAIVSPGLTRRIEENLLWALGTFVIFLVALAWAFPRLIVGLWRCPPMPPGPKRSILERFFARHHFRYKGIVLWTLFEGSQSTAGILGVFPGSRFILVTPSLLQSLDEVELEGVMAHEMGHARHRHMLFYLVFMVGLTLVFDLVLEAVTLAFTLGSLAFKAQGVPIEAWWDRLGATPTVISLLITIPALILVIVYFRFGFGLYSRNFERQSDLYALETQGTPEPLIRSFEKIAGFHPFVRLLPSWHHFSIQQRIDFLRACTANPRLMKRHHRKVRALVIGYLIFFFSLAGLLFGWRTYDWGQGWTLSLLRQIAKQQVQAKPGNASLWLALGSIAFEKGDLAAAENAFREAIRLNPQSAEACNNLAWLYATAEKDRFRKPREALELAHRAAQLQPDSPHILDTLAEAYFINGRPHRALEVERQALDLAREKQAYYRAQMERFERALGQGR
jgi:Zn-dependent protease with chaperone function